MTDFLPKAPQVSPRTYATCVHRLLAAHLDRQSEALPLAAATGRQLAGTLYAPHPAPAFANSQMDGYALTTTGCTRPDRVFTVGPDVPAGADPTGLPQDDDTAYPVMTGAPLPAGYSAVVPVERSVVLTGQADSAGFAATGQQVQLPVCDPGSFVRQVGEDVLAGEKLAEAGAPLTPALIGALAAQGFSDIEVIRPVKVLVVTGGDELAQDAGPQPSAPGQIFDANGPMLAALAQEDGALVHRMSTADSVDDFCLALTGAVQKYQPDLVITSGGISHGKYEVVRLGLAALEKNGTATVQIVESWFGHATQQPGGPQGLALMTVLGRSVPVVCLPGNPVSTLISYHLLLRPALRALAGSSPEDTHGRLEVSEPLIAPPGKTQYRRARLTYHNQSGGGVLPLVLPDAATGSHLLHRAAQADALVELEPGVTYSGGETVRYIEL